VQPMGPVEFATLYLRNRHCVATELTEPALSAGIRASVIDAVTAQ
jgi:hypothetical protein